MKGKSIFTKEEAEQIVLLIEQKLIADSKRQKGIRQKIRNLGFHAQELGVGNGYTVADFKRVVTIIGSETIKSDILPKKQSVVKASVPIKLTLSESTIQKQFSTVFSKDSIAELKNIGFKGFISVEKIIESYDVLPKQKGVYILIHSAENPNFQAIGTGGDFNYYELGEPLFLEEDILNESVGIENILKYIWYSETRTPFTTIPDLAEANYRIGSKDQTDYYFYYLM